MTRWRAVTGRRIVRMSVRWDWRRRGRSSGCGRWPPRGYLIGGSEMAPAYRNEGGYAPSVSPGPAFGASRRSRELLLRTLRGGRTMRRDDQGSVGWRLSSNPALIVGDVRDDQHGEHRHEDDCPRDD